MILIGHDNYLNANLVAVVLDFGSSHAKRVRDVADSADKLVNATSGHRVKSLIVLVSSQVVLCALKTGTVNERIQKAKNIRA